MKHDFIDILLIILFVILGLMATILFVFLIVSLISIFTSPASSYKYRLSDGSEGEAKYCYSSYSGLKCTNNEDHTLNVQEYWKNEG